MAEIGLILFAHGARDARWAAPFEALLARLRERRPELPVALAFLEHMSPDLRSAALGLAAQGARRIRVVPLFFGRGGHLREDFPAQLAAVRSAHPEIDFEIAPAAGEPPPVIDALADFALDGLDPSSTA